MKFGLNKNVNVIKNTNKVVDKNKFSNEEAYRKLRTNIEFTSFDKECKVMSVVSSLSAEGKSTISLNLARAYAAKYERVLLIDCDLRKPTIHRKMRISNKSGLSDMLVEKDKIDYTNYIQCFKLKNIQNELYVLTAGSKVPNPLELLSSNKFKTILNGLKNAFDYIIIDCPPILVVSDAIPVSREVDGTIFVISSQDTNKKDAKMALNQLKRNGINVIGTVLNKVEASSNEYYYY